MAAPTEERSRGRLSTKGKAQYDSDKAAEMLVTGDGTAPRALHDLFMGYYKQF